MADSAKSGGLPENSGDATYVLIVRHAFLDYQPGDQISDASKMKEILSGDMAVYVIRAAKAD